MTDAVDADDLERRSICTATVTRSRRIVGGRRRAACTAAARAGITIRSFRPRAQTAAGDQRINSFGIGGEIEVRSGPLVQKQTIAGTTVHVGLGTRTSIDVTRIVWPNGVPQAEFDPAVDRADRRAAAAQGIVPLGLCRRWERDAVRDGFSVAIAARVADQRAGHGRRHANRGLGEDPRRSTRRARTARTTCASQRSCGRPISSITCR